MSLNLQLALDLTSLSTAEALVGAVGSQVDRVEIGTPLLLAAGLQAVERIRPLAPGVPLIADTKICDAGERIAAAAFAAGATTVTVVPVAADRVTWSGIHRAREAAGSAAPLRIMADLIGAEDPVAVGLQAAELGADELCFHLPKRGGGSSAAEFNRAMDAARTLAGRVLIPVYLAGGLGPADLGLVGAAGVAGLIVGKAITDAADPLAAVRSFRQT